MHAGHSHETNAFIPHIRCTLSIYNKYNIHGVGVGYTPCIQCHAPPRGVKMHLLCIFIHSTHETDR